jgi:hypothetical protein
MTVNPTQKMVNCGVLLRNSKHLETLMSHILKLDERCFQFVDAVLRQEHARCAGQE